ncbi:MULTISPECIES: hypothetical protein [unclassified Nocardioides]|uniref:hypothetical protein n=1 Tax=unclassified Nocardioides TaxID=2615069 RepID=UPI0000574CE7|nr:MULTISPECIES: hypothetical protein [unclassified Nocardioides]ABL80674.1 hypothetical protein Noca_1158 [Nocardioides sp. JS614]
MRWLAALGLLVAGAVTGVAVVALHPIGWGLALGLVATGAVVAALPAGWWSRLAFVVGWDLLVGWLTFPRPEGDYVISQDLPGYTVLGAALVLIVVGIATLPRPRGCRGGEA